MQWLRQKKRKLRFHDAAQQFGWRASDAVNRANDAFHQLIDILWAAVGECPFGQGPNSFIRVKFRSVGREMFDGEPRVSREELPEGPALVRGGVIQENNEGAAELPQQLAQKQADFFLTDVVVEEEVVEAQAVSLGAQRDAGNDGDFIPAPLPIMEEGSRAPRCPSPNHQGSQQKAAFIGKNYVGAQPRGVFFTRGQSFRFQRSMASSSRSRARPSGFWRDQLIRCRSFPAVL